MPLADVRPSGAMHAAPLPKRRVTAPFGRPWPRCWWRSSRGLAGPRLGGAAGLTAEFRPGPVASLATFFAVRYAAAPPDAEHRYGHGKAEAFASLVQAGLVFASAALIGEEAIADLIHPQPMRRAAGRWRDGVSIVLTAL